MPKKKSAPKAQATPVEHDGVVRHARIELPDADYKRLKASADRYHIGIAAYIRIAVMERIERDEGKGPVRT